MSLQPPANSAPSHPEGTSLPTENVQRGVIFAIIVLPLGIVAWDILWSVGFVASIVAFGVAWGAVRLYRLGSGGRVTRHGAIAVTVITIVTLLLAFVSGFAVDLVGLYAQQTESTVAESLVSPRFWSIVGIAMTQGSSLVSLLLAVAFGALGSYRVLRGAFRQNQAQPVAGSWSQPMAQPHYPAPQQPTLMNPTGTPAIPASPASPSPSDPDDTASK
jgi:hypothetical protein